MRKPKPVERKVKSESRNKKNIKTGTLDRSIGNEQMEREMVAEKVFKASNLKQKQQAV